MKFQPKLKEEKHHKVVKMQPFNQWSGDSDEHIWGADIGDHPSNT